MKISVGGDKTRLSWWGWGNIYFTSDIYLTFFKTRHLNPDLNFIVNHLT